MFFFFQFDNQHPQKSCIENQPQDYDPKDAVSIWRYSAGLLGHTLRDFVNEENLKEYTGKGALGQMVEEIYFHIANNSRAEADFHAAGMELKCTPLKEGKKEPLLIKERLVCGMINYGNLVKEEFEESHFYTKCQLMLLLFYLHIKDVDKLDLKFLISLLWRFPEKDLEIIRQDYYTIVNKVKQGLAHELSEGDTLYLGACRKGVDGTSVTEQPNSEIMAPTRAFCLKQSYMSAILKRVLHTGEKHLNTLDIELPSLVTTKALKKESFETIISKRYKKYIGKDYQKIAESIGVNLSKNPKNKFAMIASAIGTGGEKTNINATEEFLKSGLMMKSIRVQANGRIKESMAFENINYTEVFNEENEWIDSRCYDIFTSRFMFVIFREQTPHMEDYVLDKIFFWTMPPEDLEIAEQYWSNIKQSVMDNRISPEYFWKISDHRLFHVRPKGQNKQDLAPNPHGGEVQKYCYWFNNEYITDIVNKHTK